MRLVAGQDIRKAENSEGIACQQEQEGTPKESRHLKALLSFTAQLHKL